MGRLGWAVILGCILGMVLFGILQQRGCRADADSAPRVAAPPPVAATPAPTPSTPSSSTPSWTRSGGYSAPAPATSSSAAAKPPSPRDAEYEDHRRLRGVGQPNTPTPFAPQPTILDNTPPRRVNPAATPRTRPTINVNAVQPGVIPTPTPASPLAANVDAGVPQTEMWFPTIPDFAPQFFAPGAGGSRSTANASSPSSASNASPALGGLGSNPSNAAPAGGGFSVVTGLSQPTTTPGGGGGGGNNNPAPSAFALVFPANNARDVPAPIQLRWSTSSNATLYRVRIATSASLASPILDRANLSSITFTIPDGTLAPNTTYFWSVTASNAASTTRDADAVFSFTTAASTPTPTGPGAFALTAPANNVRGLTGTITLAWGASQGATSYSVDLARDNAFTQLLTTRTTSQTSLSLADLTLEPGATVFWRVEARNASGQRLAGPFSFTPLGKPGAFTLLTPADNANPAPSPVILTWSPSLDAASYRVEIATDAAFQNRVINRGNISAPTLALLPSELQPGTRYFWRVTASNAIDFTGSTPAVRSFTTRAGPGPFALVSPDNDASVGVPVTLQWDASEGALLYRVEVSTSESFATTIVSQLVVPLVSGTQFTIPEDVLTLGQRYFWRVTASNEGGDRRVGPRAFRAGVADFDVNRDGVVDVLDMYAYAALTTPTDLNGDGRADAADRTGLRNAVRSREAQDIVIRN